MKKRTPKDTDQENVKKSCDMICDLVKLNPEIDGCIWISAFYACITQAYVNAGISYEEFCEDIKDAIEKYKPWFEERKNELD